jgi:hypothetical protein
MIIKNWKLDNAKIKGLIQSLLHVPLYAWSKVGFKDLLKNVTWGSKIVLNIRKAWKYFLNALENFYFNNF